MHTLKPGVSWGKGWEMVKRVVGAQWWDGGKKVKGSRREGEVELELNRQSPINLSTNSGSRPSLKTFYFTFAFCAPSTSVCISNTISLPLCSLLSSLSQLFPLFLSLPVLFHCISLGCVFEIESAAWYSKLIMINHVCTAIVWYNHLSTTF